MTDQTSPETESDYELKRVEMLVCTACLDGIGQECHTPGCSMFLHSVDLPFPKDTYREIDGLAQRQQQPITDEMVKVGAAAMCCQAQTLGCDAKNKDSEFSTCMLSTFMQDARRCLEAALAVSSTDRTWHEAMADRVLQLKIGGAKNLSCDAVLGLIAFVRDGEGSVAVTSPERASK